MGNIRLSGIKKIYGGREVLNIERFEFKTGMRYALLGANGAGKSTLLRILAGLLMPDEGKMENSICLEKQDAAYLPQKPYNFALKVEKSILLGASKAEREDTKHIEKVLELVGMKGFEKQREDKLSGGEAQRIALARILIRPRKLLLLDEPSSATDIAGMKLIENAITDFCKQTGSTLIFSSHSPAQAVHLADTAIFLHRGNIEEFGDAKKVVTEPSGENAKAFLSTWLI